MVAGVVIAVVCAQVVAFLFALAFCRAGDDPEPHELGTEREAPRAVSGFTT